MRVILDFVDGPMDGTVTLDSMPQQGEQFASYEEFVVAMAYFQTKGEVGKRFHVLSLGRLTATVVRPGQDSVFPSYVYEVTESLPAESEMLIRAKYVTQNA